MARFRATEVLSSKHINEHWIYSHAGSIVRIDAAIACHSVEDLGNTLRYTLQRLKQLRGVQHNVLRCTSDQNHGMFNLGLFCPSKLPTAN